MIALAPAQSLLEVLSWVLLPQWVAMSLAYRPENVRVVRFSIPDDLQSPVARDPDIALHFKVFLPPWVIARLAAEGFTLISPPNESAPIKVLHVGERFVLTFADSGTNQRFNIIITALPYDMSPHSSGGRLQVLLSIPHPARNGEETQQHGLKRKEVFADAWGSKWRKYKHSSFTLNLKFIRMGDFRVQGDRFISNCDVYQIDIVMHRV